MSSKVENQKRKVLTVDDDPESLKILKKALEWDGYQVETANSGSEAVAKISEWRPHLVLLDVNMPGLNGLETLSFLRNGQEYISTIFVSGKSSPDDVMRGLDAGADDYICKPFNPLELLSRIRCHLRIKDIRDELTRANARLKELVDIDDLTGLFNMRSLYQKLDYELDRSSRYNRSVAVVMMDMDHFKSANDENDHLFGSYILAEVGKIIKENMRKVDFAARYGGDEFLIVLTETNAEGAETFCERLRTTIESTTFTNDQHSKKLTSSLGYAITSEGSPSVDARTLVRYADRALYNSKEKGRNRVEYYDFAAESGTSNVTTIGKQLLRRNVGNK
ncbi:MAG: diguanylate cyclase [Bdellovibrionales bacterium]|nr:diguanylate cyclase [Bdellovibrionales bacterium]